MGSLPRVSVLLPCRDAGTTLDAALYSLSTQSFVSFEVLAIDDGSTDQTAGILRAWEARDARVRVFSSDRRGLVSALQMAATHSRGALLARMDADDIAHPHRFREQVAFLDANPAIAACGTGVRYIPREAVRVGARRYERWINSVVSSDDIERDLFVECPIPHPTLILRRSAFESIGGYRDVEWPEDYDLILRLWASGHQLGKVPDVLLDWRESAGRASRTDARYSEDAFRRCKIAYIGRRIGGRSVAVCGAGPVGKAFARALLRHGHPVAAFVDVDPRKIGQMVYEIPVVSMRERDAYRDCYLLAAVGSDRGRADIRADLTTRGLVEPRDFCAVA